MLKNYIGTAKNIAEFSLNIVAENEEEALEILDDIVSNFELFSIKENQRIALSVEEESNQSLEKNNSHSDENETNLCENCEFYCPFCQTCFREE